MPFLAKIKSKFPHPAKGASKNTDPAAAPPNKATKEQHGDVSRTSSSDIQVPLRTVDLPRVLPVHRASLANQGWTTITYDTPSDALESSAQELLRASKTFFDLPTSYKKGFQTQQGSEEGWSCIKGEKEFITLRTLDHTPEELKAAASVFWAQAGGLLNEILGRIAQSLGLPPNALMAYSEPCIELGPEKWASMVRLFKYEASEGNHSRIVAEGHKDLGLLSLVIGGTPGLEVWDMNSKKWFPIEKAYNKPAATVLVGRQVEWLSNRRYLAGGHLVRSYPELPPASLPQSDPAAAKESRYSLVFVLRAHSPVPVDTDALTTPITGQFHTPIKGITGGQLFDKIQRLHFNVNTGVQEREEQKRKLAEKQNNLLL